MNSFDASSALQKLCQANRRRAAGSFSLSSIAFSTWAIKVSERSTSPADGGLDSALSYASRMRAASSKSPRSSSFFAMFRVLFSTSVEFIMNSACGATTVELRSPLGVDGSGRSNAWNISYSELRTTGR